MRTRSKVLIGILGLIGVAVAGLAVLLSYSAACGPSPAVAVIHPMRAAVARCYGSADVIRLETIEQPVPAEHGLLIRVHASSVNPVDWHTLRGSPYLMRASSGFGTPHDILMGTDFEGTVEAVGTAVTGFKPGDEVFGGADGSFGQYVRVRESGAVVVKPANVGIEDAAAIPVAGLTALQALRDQGHIKAGQKVLINGAGGGVGTYAVQIAKALGAEVTAVTNPASTQLVGSLGADHVIDYTREDFTAGADRYDLILDLSGNHPMSAYARSLLPSGVYVFGGDTNHGNWLGPLDGFIRTVIAAKFSKQKFEVFFADLKQADLKTLAELMQAGKVKAAIDRRYDLDHIAEAIRYQETGHARGKVLVSIDGPARGAQ
jgi:NADPH:quinone reductase-like Zn-dependent oxidoreductase